MFTLTDQKYCILALLWFHCIPLLSGPLFIPTNQSTITFINEFIADHSLEQFNCAHNKSVPILSQLHLKSFCQFSLLQSTSGTQLLNLFSISSTLPASNSHQTNQSHPLTSYINHTGYLLANLTNVADNLSHVVTQFSVGFLK